MAAYSFTYTDTTITITVTWLSVGDLMEIVVRPEPETGYMNVHVTPTATSSVMEFTFGGLEPSTDYAVNVRSVPAGGVLHNAPWIGARYFTTDAESDVDDWDWMISNGSASTAQTQFAYSIFFNTGANAIETWDLKKISYLVWNDMVNKTHEVVANRGGEWNTTYGTLAETLMTATDKHMTARRFNAIVWNLAQYKTPNVTRKNQGDPMLGSYFIDLADSINNTIYRG